MPEDEFNRIVSSRYGQLIANLNDTYIGSAIHVYGEYSQLEMDLFESFIKPGDIVMEVGANIGAHTLGLARMVGSAGRVVAIEAQPILFQTLCGNMAINSITHVECMNFAASNGNGYINVPFHDYSKKGNFGGISLCEAETGFRIEMKQLDNVFYYPSLALLKIDVEGMEQEVLEGATNLITKFKPILYVENDRVELSQPLIELIFELGYKAWWHTPPLFNKDNFNRFNHNIYQNIISANMLCLRKDVEFTTDLPVVEDSTRHIWAT